MNKGREWISRSVAAQRLNVSASMVSRYCRQGAPSRPDKRVPWPEIRSWVEEHVIAERSGNFFHRVARREGAAGAIEGPRSCSHPGPGNDDPVLELLRPDRQTRFFQLLRALNLSERDAATALAAYGWMVNEHTADPENTPKSFHFDDWGLLAPGVNIDAIDEELWEVLKRSESDAA